MSRAAIHWQPVNLWRVQRAVDEGRLDPAARITMRELRDSGAAGKRVQHGFKLLAKVPSVMAAQTLAQILSLFVDSQ